MHPLKYPYTAFYLDVVFELLPPIVHPPVDVSVKPRWNDIDRGIPKNSEKNLL
jgi:hypothetical protein